MDIERELEILINKHKGKQVGLGEIRLDWFAEDCLKEIRRLKSEIARQSVTSEEVKRAIDQIESLIKAIGNDMHWRSEKLMKSLNLAITALKQYQPWIPVSERLPESGKHVLLCCEIRPLGKRYVCDGYYAQEKSIASGYSDECSNEYDEETDEYYLTEGYYEIIKNWGDYSSIAIDDFVTHYLPLPEPPEPPKGE